MEEKANAQNNEPAPSIKLEATRYLATVERLRRAAWRSFDRRRAFEWKVSFGLWTAQAAVLASLALGKVQAKTLYDFMFLCVLSVSLIVIHLGWSYFLHQVNSADLNKSYAYGKEQMRVLGMNRDTEVGKEVHGIIDRMQKRSKTEKAWGHIFQVGMTFLLAVSTMGLAFPRATA